MDKVVITEKDLINVELLNCYNYFLVLEKMKKEKNIIDDSIKSTLAKEKSLKQKCTYDLLYNDEKIKNIFEDEKKSYYNFKLKEVADNILLEKEQKLDSILHNNNVIRKKLNKIFLNLILILFSIFFIILGLIVWGLGIGVIIVSAIDFFKGKGFVMLLVIAAVAAVFGGIGYLIFKLVFYLNDKFGINSKRSLKKQIQRGEQEANELSQCIHDIEKKIEIKDYSFLSKDITYSIKVKANKKYTFSRWIENHSYLYDNNPYVYLVKTSPTIKKEYYDIINYRNQLNCQSKNYNNSIMHFEKVEKENIIEKLKYIPVFYFREDCVKKMLLLMSNKRADTIKELVNLYEETVWQGQMLNSLNNINMNINRLIDDLNYNFKMLSLQLNIFEKNILDTIETNANKVTSKLNLIDNSIKINTMSNILNYNVLKNIQDDNHKHYLEMSYNINKLNKFIEEPIKAEIEII